MPETLPATATVTASSIDCTVAVLKVPTPTMQMPQACNLQSLGIIMEPNNINIELNPAAATSSLKRCLRVRPPRTLNPETRTKNNSTPAPCSDRTNPVHNAHMLLSFHFEAACAQWATADLFGK
ncbi:uncharacterized protein Dmoj_GI15023 [Drosophila mojavensis]|uniref:Uncharacterized protein n=1 Tax=Drosophila mojavensis TaxID=7230 RepID=B4L3M4_DROMO|nr:uncharacterized protein Dmoj_GI15023 [Drosophila mojavensis]